MESSSTLGCAPSIRHHPTDRKMVHPIAEANETSPFGSISSSEFYAHHSVSHSSQFITNSSGLKLFTQTWIPVPPTKIIGTLSVLHGFQDNSSWIVQLTCVYFAKCGFATAAIDYQGHGNSEGLRGHIPDINTVVRDCTGFFYVFRSRYPSTLPSFLYGESLGGAIALLIHLNRSLNQQPWNGIILHGSMCHISGKYKPLWPLEHLSFLGSKLIPKWKVVPTGSLPHLSFKEEWKRKLCLACPDREVGFPRVATAHELMRVCRELQARFEEVVAPILIVHGGADMVCDVNSVKELYRRAQSEDKTIRVYDGMWHLLVGGSDDEVELVFGDMVKWLRERTERVDTT